MKKEGKFDDNIVEILLGSLLIGLNNFNDGMLLEKVFVIFGFLILIVGIIRTIMKYRGQNKKAMTLFLIIMGIVSIVAFLSLFYRFIFA